MPEAPDLEVIKSFLNSRVLGQQISSARVLKPTVLRSPAGDFSNDIQGRTLDLVHRRGKFLLAELSRDRWLAINPMLTGALQYCEPKARVYKKTCFVLSLAEGWELRYLDDRQMGKVYYVNQAQLAEVPLLNEQGPDVLEGITFEEFTERLRRFHGEIKGVLTRGAFISGIGNAYSDEILFAADRGNTNTRQPQCRATWMTMWAEASKPYSPRTSPGWTPERRRARYPITPPHNRGAARSSENPLGIG